MKISEYTKYKTFLSKLDLANLFNIVESPDYPNYARYNLLSSIDFSKLTEDEENKLFSYYVIKQGDTILSIANTLYQSVRAAWFVCKINNITDMFKTLVPGETLKVVSQDLYNLIVTSLSDNA